DVRSAPADLGSAAALAPASVATGSRWQPHFTFAGPGAARWFPPPDGVAISYSVGAGDTGIGESASLAAVDAPLSAWSAPASTNLRLVRGGRAEPGSFGNCDGKTQIMFDDPADEIADPIDCAGVLAVGGICTSGDEAITSDGSRFLTITEGDVVINNGF